MDNTLTIVILLNGRMGSLWRRRCSDIFRTRHLGLLTIFTALACRSKNQEVKGSASRAVAVGAEARTTRLFSFPSRPPLLTSYFQPSSSRHI